MRKKSNTNDRYSEEFNARISESKAKAAIARGTPYVLKRNRYLLHGQNNAEITAVARTKPHEEGNCCVRDKNNTNKSNKIPA